MASIPLDAPSRHLDRTEAEEVDFGLLTRAVLGSQSGRLDLQLDLLASAWLAALIAAVADYRAGLVFLVVAFALTAVSARSGPQA